MEKYNWVDISRDDVIRAIEKFKKYNPEYPEPKSTFLIYEGEKLPAKHIRGMAYEEHYGVAISKNDFAGGLETVKFFERLGFDIEYNSKSVEKAICDSGKSKTGAVCDRNIENKAENQKCRQADSDRITIPSSDVIEQKNALQLILNKIFEGDIVCEKTYPWLKTPDVIEGEYSQLYEALSNYRGDKNFAKKNVTLRCDFVCEGKKLIIEYDERQHFSEARKVALESYRDVPVCFDREKWIKACADIKAKDNSPKNRDEVRAYYDSTRDIECARHGYHLVRIMHGQVNFEQDDAREILESMLKKELGTYIAPLYMVEESNNTAILKVCMYLQTEEFKNKKAYDKHMEIIKQSDVDLVVFPEFSYFPRVEEVWDCDIVDVNDIDHIFDIADEISRDLGRAVVINSNDKYGSIVSVFANAFASEKETQGAFYIKHTMTPSSVLDFASYPEMVKDGFFDPILYKGFKIGMTICYDCNHSIFSRMYELSGGIDLIVNSTGGDVVYDKWYKYNKARAVENSCYELVTMGGDGTNGNSKNYVYGFNANGGELPVENLNGTSMYKNVPGGLYVFEVKKDAGKAEADESNQTETENKKFQFEYPVGKSKTLLDKSERLSSHLYRLKHGENNIIFCLVDGMDIMKPEKVLPLLYAQELQQYKNKKYVIINRHQRIDEKVFSEKLSVILKVRAMENFCAVVLESDNLHKCYQAGKNRTAQVVKSSNGIYGIDLDRTTGPEAIWRDKQGMRASWRNNFEWLVRYAESIS